MKKIETSNAPKAIGPYSQAVQAGSFLFVSGQLAINPKTGTIVAKTIEEETRQALQNIEAILHAAHLEFRHVVKVEIFLKNMEDFQAMNRVYGEFFTHSIQPARQAVEVSKLPLNALIEISCVALIEL